MARLCILGIPFSKGSGAARFKTQPAFRLLPRRVTYRANPVSPCRSFLPVSAPRTGVRSLLPVSTLKSGIRSFSELRKGSHLPVRSITPTPGPSFCISSQLQERRAARQERSRPWVKSRSTTVSSKSTLSKPSPKPSKPKVQATHTMRALRSIARIDNVLAKRKTTVKSKGKGKSVMKRVRFGESTVVPVSRWIVRQEHVYPAPILAMGHLQGWSVTALREPDEDGEEEKYTTYWGSDSYIMLTSNHAHGPCDREGCAWNSLARIQAKRPTWYPEMVFKAWLMKRAMIRKRGGFAL